MAIDSSRRQLYIAYLVEQLHYRPHIGRVAVYRADGKGGSCCAWASRGRAWPWAACAVHEVFAKHASIKELAQAYANWPLVDGKKIMGGWPTSFGQIARGVGRSVAGGGCGKRYLEGKQPVSPITGCDVNSFLKQICDTAAAYQVSQLGCFKSQGGEPYPNTRHAKRSISSWWAICCSVSYEPWPASNQSTSICLSSSRSLAS
jgi:hypothetical protein